MTPASIDVSVHADYHCFTVFDSTASEDEMPADPWDKSALTGLLCAPRVLMPTTWSRWGFVPVRLEVREAAPADPIAGSHVVEATLECTSGRLSVGGWLAEEAVGMQLPVGVYAVRVSWFGLPDQGDPVADHEMSAGEGFKIEVWPASPASVRVIRQSPLWGNEALRTLFSPLAE